MNRIAILLLLAGAAFAQSGSAKNGPDQARRLTAFKVLSTGKPIGKVRLTEDLVVEVEGWFKKGDQEALDHLLDAMRHSDGAVSASLNITLGHILIKHPKPLLLAVSKRPISEQRQIAQSTFSADGAGYEPSVQKKVRIAIQGQASSSDPAVRATSVLWLKELDSFEKSL